MSQIRKKLYTAENHFDSIRMRIKSRLNLFDPVIIFPYNGYGTGRKAWLKGRVLEREEIIHTDEEHPNTLWYNLRKIWKRFESDEIPGVEVEGELHGVKARCVTDNEGYFDLVFESPEKFEDGWHRVTLGITQMPYALEYEEATEGHVLISNRSDNFGIISDVDDTIVHSAAVNPLRKLQILLTRNAQNRVAFEGVEELYSQLHQDGRNPLFFVSGSSWNLYDLLDDFCHHHRIPKAPFFLRDLGLRADQWLKEDTSPYKKDYIRHIMEVFSHLKFILIGDSGQKDPEIYMDICREFPRRIMGVYIRHVDSEKRKQQLLKLAGESEIPFLVMDNSEEALRHAREEGWIRGDGQMKKF